MTRERFSASLRYLGCNLESGWQLLGISRSTIYRISRGTTEVPETVVKLLDMYERHGVPPEHREPQE